MAALRFGFKFACFSTAFAMTVFWLYKHMKDEDLCQLDFKPFNTLASEQHPILSICFTNPILEAKLKLFNSSLTEQHYLDIIKGESPYNGIDKIDFEDVTLNLADFYLGDTIQFRNGTLVGGGYPNLLNDQPQVSFSGLQDNIALVKCFGLQFNYTDITYASFGFNSSIFPNGIGPNSQFYVYIHMPDQLLMSTSFHNT